MFVRRDFIAPFLFLAREKCFVKDRCRHVLSGYTP